MSASVLLAATADGGFAGELAAAGVDRIVAYHSSVYRRRGLPSVAGLLPWGSANEQTLGALPAVVAGAGKTPVIATVCANDGLLPCAEMLERVSDLGAVGVLNAPTVGLLTGPVRAVLEETGLGLQTELDLLAAARERGLEAWAYVFDPASALAARSAGATGLVVHLGITGHPSDPDRTAAEVVAEILDVLTVPAGSVGPADLAGPTRPAGPGGQPGPTGPAGPVPVLLHGGNLRTPTDLAAVLAALPAEHRDRITGFFGASAFEARAADEPVGAVVGRWRATLDHARPTPTHPSAPGEETR